MADEVTWQAICVCGEVVDEDADKAALKERCRLGPARGHEACDALGVRIERKEEGRG